MKSLLSKSKLLISVSSYARQYGITVLMRTSLNDNAALMQLLLEKGANIEAKNKVSMASIHYLVDTFVCSSLFCPITASSSM